jgi:subfamily B ATP-binding cassette protein MsbA
MSSPRPYATRPLTRRLIRAYVGKYRWYLCAAAICMVLSAATTGATAYMMQPILDEVFVSQNRAMLTLVPLAIVGIFILAGLSDYTQNMLMRYVGQKVVADMQGDLFAHLIHADLTTFHDQASGRLVSRFTNDIQLLRQAASNVLVGFAKELLTMIALIGVMFYQSWELSFIAFFILIFAIFPIIRLGKRMRKVADATQESLGDFTQQLDETFLGVRVVKAYGREPFEVERVRQSIRQLVKHYMKAAKIGAAVGPIMEILGGFAIAAIIYYGGHQVIAGDTTPGAFFSFITAMIMAYRPVKVVASLNTQLQEGLAAAARFFKVIDQKPHIHDTPDAQPLQFSHGRIMFDDVTFHYPGTAATGIHALSFTVPAGATVALVGPSGGGKSTIMNLLLRFYESSSGRITIDGQDIRDVTLASLRAVTALVSQEVVLFDDTVRANIAYGRLDASEAEIIASAKQAYAHEFIQSLPQGYDTVIGPQGVKLSGGQRQRLSIARAILKNAPILLLDEATSALDNESERAVQRALNELMRGRTTLVVAHRLSTVQHASSILVLADGRLIEHGTHDQLLAKSGLYHRLYHTQFEGA